MEHHNVLEYYINELIDCLIQQKWSVLFQRMSYEGVKYIVI